MRILLTVLLAATAIPALAASPTLSPQRSAATRTMFETIVNMPTVIGRHQTPAMAQYLADQYIAAGFPKDDVHVMRYHTGSATTGEDDTAALIVRWRVAARAASQPACSPAMPIMHCRSLRQRWSIAGFSPVSIPMR